MLKSICAWCQKEKDNVSAGSCSDTQLTHGICEECANKIFAELGTDLNDFLDSLSVPVIVVDSNVTVKTANRQAQLLMKKDLPSIEGYKGGNVFECIHARTPEGCGNTIHCSGCTIRNSVMDTFESGESHLNVPATLNTSTPDDNQKIKYIISTEKVEEVVLLKIEKVGNDEDASLTKAE